MAYLSPAQSGNARRKRAVRAAKDFQAACEKAIQLDMELRKCSEIHYQLRWGPGRQWILNLYPCNQRLAHDRNNTGLFLDMRGKGVDDPWSLFDVIQAAARARDKGRTFEATHIDRGPPVKGTDHAGLRD